MEHSLAHLQDLIPTLAGVVAYRTAGFVCKTHFLRRIPVVVYVIIMSVKKPITKLRDLIKSSCAMACEVESDYCYRLCNQRIPHLQGCLGELATLEKCYKSLWT